MSNIFLYPKADKVVGSPNPYITNFINALSKHHKVLNEQAKNKGVLNLFKFLFQSDIFIFNWIENLPEKRYGRLQVILFVFFISCAKILKKKIVWILHNKYSHHRKKDSWIDFMFSFMMKKAGLIITHSDSGVEFVKKNYPEFSSKVKMLVHPTQDIIPKTSNVDKVYDVLIWGSIFPYKGILQFLDFVKENKALSSLKILIVGRCADGDYKQKLINSMTANVTFNDKLYGMDEISNFASQARFTLFTYKPLTVISSGSLMDSIRMGSRIIGPNHGAFRDLKDYGFMKTYDEFEDIIPIIKNSMDTLPDSKELVAFCEDNSWDSFVQKLNKALLL